MVNIIMTTHWLEGDVLPFIRIGKELVNRGHRVTLITHCVFQKRAVEAGLLFEAIDNQAEFDKMIELMNKDEDNNSSFDEEKELKELCESNERRSREVSLIEKHIEKDNTILFAKTRSSIAAYLVSEIHKIPLVAVFMNTIEPLSMLSFEDLFGEKEKIRFNELRKQYNLPEVNSWLDWQKCPKKTLGLWPDWYGNEDSDWPAKIEKVGFALEEKSYDNPDMSDLPCELVKCLDEKPILIMGSTARRIKKEYYPLAIRAAAKTGKKVVVLCKYKELLPEDMPENVLCYEYINLEKILNKVSLLIHHGGLGGVSQSLLLGIPQMILPGFIDQPFNAKICEKIGVACQSPYVKWNEDEIKEKIEYILAGNLTNKCQEYKEKMTENDGISKACDIILDGVNDESLCISVIKEEIRDNKMTKNLSPQQKMLLLKKLKEKKNL